MKHCPNERCAHRVRTGRPGEYQDNATTCADCGQELVVGPAHAGGRATLDMGPTSRLLVTVAAIGAFVVGRTMELRLGELEVRPFHLGLLPLLAAFIVVEAVVVLVPALRKLRWRQRTRLRHITWLAAAVIATALSIANASVPLEGVVWVTAVVVLAVLAELVRRVGLGDGYAVLILAATLPNPGSVDTVARAGGDHRVLAIVVLASVVAATLMILRTHERTGGPRLPLCGILPLDVAALLGVPLALHTPATEAFLQASRSVSLIAAGAVAVVVGATLSLLIGRGRGAIGLAVLRSTLFVAALFAAGSLLATIPLALPGVYVVALTTAVALDVLREWRARGRREAWVKLASPASLTEAEAILDCLRSDDIPALTRGMAVRSLLRFAGPFVALEVHVPEGEAPRARELLSRTLV